MKHSYFIESFFPDRTLTTS